MQAIGPQAVGSALVSWQEGDCFRKAPAAAAAGIAPFLQVDDGLQAKCGGIPDQLFAIIVDGICRHPAYRAQMGSALHADDNMRLLPVFIGVLEDGTPSGL